MSSNEHSVQEGPMTASPASTGRLALHRSARASLASIALTAVIITLNHWFVLGPRALVLGATLILAPTALFLWFRRTQSRVALAGYLLMNIWVITGFGWYKGLWKGILRLFEGTWLARISTSFAVPRSEERRVGK